MDQQTSVRRTPPRLAPSRGSLAALYKSLNLEPPPERNLQIFDHIPPGFNVCAVTDSRMAPLIRAGEIAIFDEADFLPAEDELFVIETPRTSIGGLRSTPSFRKVVEIFRTELRGRESWWFLPAYKPQLTDDRTAWNQRRVRNCSDGPFTTEELMDRLIGRVVGIFQPHGETTHG